MEKAHSWCLKLVSEVRKNCRLLVMVPVFRNRFGSVNFRKKSEALSVTNEENRLAAIDPFLLLCLSLPLLSLPLSLSLSHTFSSLCSLSLSLACHTHMKWLFTAYLSSCYSSSDWLDEYLTAFGLSSLSSSSSSFHLLFSFSIIVRRKLVLGQEVL